MDNHLKVFCLESKEEWKNALTKFKRYDIYHLPEYHLLSEQYKWGTAKFFLYNEKQYSIGIPLLFHNVDCVEGIEKPGYLDAVSVYGYPGPITNEIPIPKSIIKKFFQILNSYFEKNNIVSFITRLNPVIQHEYLTKNYGNVDYIGPTVSIDLRLSNEKQVDQYIDGHNYDISKAKDEGVECFQDTGWDYYDNFIDIYYETMKRVNAADYYFFSREYFERMKDLLNEQLLLFIAVKDDTVISGSLFTKCKGIIQYHLSGTKTDYLNLSPSKLILDSVRCWGNDSGLEIFHLGGGVGGKEDGVFQFKAGFSNNIHKYEIWHKVINRDIYKEINKQKLMWNEQQGLEFSDSSYFPKYRGPVRKKREGDI